MALFMYSDYAFGMDTELPRITEVVLENFAWRPHRTAEQATLCIWWLMPFSTAWMRLKFANDRKFFRHAKRAIAWCWFIVGLWVLVLVTACLLTEMKLLAFGVPRGRLVRIMPHILDWVPVAAGCAIALMWWRYRRSVRH